jgi:hypothetical protein
LPLSLIEVVAWFLTASWARAGMGSMIAEEKNSRDEKRSREGRKSAARGKADVLVTARF